MMIYNPPKENQKLLMWVSVVVLFYLYILSTVGSVCPKLDLLVILALMAVNNSGWLHTGHSPPV